MYGVKVSVVSACSEPQVVKEMQQFHMVTWSIDEEITQEGRGQPLPDFLLNSNYPHIRNR